MSHGEYETAAALSRMPRRGVSTRDGKIEPPRPGFARTRGSGPRRFSLTNPLKITMFPFFIRVPARRGRFGAPGPLSRGRRGTTGGLERSRSDGKEREHHERAGEGQEHRHQRPHRLGQDDAHRAHPLLHQPHPRDPRRQGQGRRRREDGLDGARARARHHHPVGRDQLLLGRLHHQHHRHPRARRLHDRGRALAARARRRDPRALLGRRRAVPEHHRRPADEPLQGAAHRLHQQVRPHRRQPRARRRPAAREAQPQRRDAADPDRPRDRPGRRRRPDHDEGDVLRRRQRRGRPHRGDPRRTSRPTRRASARSCSTPSRCSRTN